MEGKPVVVRTLDIGGDKELPYLHLPKEMNPFLRIPRDSFMFGRTRYFPYAITCIVTGKRIWKFENYVPNDCNTWMNSVKRKQFLKKKKQSLVANGTTVSDHIEVGIMVEIPSTAVLADQFAKEVDFFSIGTNDLIQYTMAADRMNERVSYLYQPYNPAILRLVKMVIDAAHKEGKWAGMCGEMAGDAMLFHYYLA